MKSLQGRLLWGFAGCTVVLWVALVAWGFYTMVTDGKRGAIFEMTRYAKQLLVVAQAFDGSPADLGAALARVELLENTDAQGQRPVGDDHRVVLQMWRDGMPLIASALPSVPTESALSTQEPATPGFAVVELADETWWTVVVRDQASAITVRVADSATLRGTLSIHQWFYFLLPLVISLPLLLLPAWYMTRRGLQPLRELAQEVAGRSNSGGLTELGATGYRELNPLVEANNQLMRRLGDQLAKERTFVANIAHEMKTPLAIVQANAERLAAQLAGGAGDTLDDLLAGIGRSDHLIQQLLRLARLEQDQDIRAAPRRIDLAEFVRQRVAQVEPLASARQIKLAVQAPDGLVELVDLDAFAAVLDNLLDNAIKYTKQPGSVWVRLDKHEAAIRLVVEDDGGGIPASEREQAFERFTRLGDLDAQTQISGAGLGLSIVRQAAERLGGSIALAARPADCGLEATLVFQAHADR